MDIQEQLRTIGREVAARDALIARRERAQNAEVGRLTRLHAAEVARLGREREAERARAAKEVIAAEARAEALAHELTAERARRSEDAALLSRVKALAILDDLNRGKGEARGGVLAALPHVPVRLEFGQWEGFSGSETMNGAGGFTTSLYLERVFVGVIKERTGVCVELGTYPHEWPLSQHRTKSGAMDAARKFLRDRYGVTFAGEVSNDEF